MAISSNNNSEIKSILNSLASHLEQIETNTVSLQQQVKQLSKNRINTSGHRPTIIGKPELKSGCYIFSDEKGFFCPSCYDNNAHKVATQRINSKQRVCPVCRASLK